MISNKEKEKKEGDYRIYIRCNAPEFKIISAIMEKGFSAREVLAHSGKPCECCSGIVIPVFNDEGEQVLIPKGILSKRK